jgi:hypothetical protein
LPPSAKRRRTSSPVRVGGNGSDDDFAYSDVDERASRPADAVAGGNMVCPKHPIHLFNDKVSILFLINVPDAKVYRRKLSPLTSYEISSKNHDKKYLIGGINGNEMHCINFIN